LSNFEDEVLMKLDEIQEVIDAIIMKEDDFTLVNHDGENCTVDREKYLEFGLDAVTYMLQCVIGDIEKRKDQKSEFYVIK
jgi:hypothetical protein